MRSLERMVAILEAVAESREPLLVTKIASRVGLSASTTWRIATELASEGMLEQGNPRGGFRLGPRLLSIAAASRVHNDVLDLALPEMEALRDSTGETLSLHVRAGGRRICIAEVQSRHQLRRVVPLGLSLPLHLGATGWVLLSGLPEQEREDYINRLGLEASACEQLKRNVSITTAQGWAYAADTWAPGISGLSVPVQGSPGIASGALSVSGPSSRWTQDVMRPHIPLVLRSAARIGVGLSRTWADATIADTFDVGQL